MAFPEISETWEIFLWNKKIKNEKEKIIPENNSCSSRENDEKIGMTECENTEEIDSEKVFDIEELFVYIGDVIVWRNWLACHYIILISLSYIFRKFLLTSVTCIYRKYWPYMGYPLPKKSPFN